MVALGEDLLRCRVGDQSVLVFQAEGMWRVVQPGKGGCFGLEEGLAG